MTKFNHTSKYLLTSFFFGCFAIFGDFCNAKAKTNGNNELRTEGEIREHRRLKALSLESMKNRYHEWQKGLKLRRKNCMKVQPYLWRLLNEMKPNDQVLNKIIKRGVITQDNKVRLKIEVNTDWNVHNLEGAIQQLGGDYS